MENDRYFVDDSKNMTAGFQIPWATFIDKSKKLRAISEMFHTKKIILNFLKGGNKIWEK